MSKKQFVADLRPGTTVESVFVLAEKRLLDFRNKPGQFLALTLRDKTGNIEAKVWENAAAVAGRLTEGNLVCVTGKVETYRQVLQLNVQTVEVTNLTQDGTPDLGPVEVSDFMPTTTKDIPELKERILATVSSVQNPSLKRMLELFFEDAAFLERFSTAPAAKALHHAYLGGLIEHIVEVLELCEPMLRLYPQIDRDLLMTGVLLHDIGKVRELHWGVTTDYTDEGRLMGHIMIGSEMVLEKIHQIDDFPPSLRLRVLHMILSHHGTLEFGSPKRPKTLEAQALHLIENLDAQLKGFVQTIEAVDDPDQAWTPFDRRFERYLYTGHGDLRVADTSPEPPEGPIPAGQEGASGSRESLF